MRRSSRLRTPVWIFVPSVAAVLGLLLLLQHAAEAQGTAPAQATLAAPLDSEVVGGEVQIRGIATATNFVRYEIALLQEFNQSAGYQGLGSSDKPVSDGLLATWDTAAVRATGARFYPDGSYSVRLRVVYRENGQETQIETVRNGIVVANQPESLATSQPITDTAASDSGGSSNPITAITSFNWGDLFGAMRSSFCAGAYLAFLAFAALVVYGVVRTVVTWVFRLIFDGNRRG